MNKNIFYAIFRFISLNHFQAIFFFFFFFFYKILREKESYMVKVDKQDTFNFILLLGGGGGRGNCFVVRVSKIML